MSNLRDDLRVALRRLRRSPVFTAVAVTSLALAIAANTAVFGLVDAVLFAPFPFPDGERVVRAWEEHPARGFTRFGVSAPAFRDWREEVRALASVAAFTRRAANLEGAAEPQRVQVLEATTSILDVLAVRPRLGRAFGSGEEAPGGDAVVLLAYDFWRTAMAARPDVVGTTVRLDGVAHEVLGVLPPEAAAFDAAALWRPLTLHEDTRRGARWLEVVGRLRPGASVASASTELASVARRHEGAYPETNTGWTATLVPLREARASGSRPLLVALWGAATLVLLIAGANVAGLLLARASEREGELAVRAALGAAPGRLARLMAAECALVALFGGAAGLALSFLARQAVAFVAGPALPAAAAFDRRAVAFTLLTTLVTSLAFALVPVRRGRRVGLERALRMTGRGAAPSHLRLRRVLVAAELAMAVALLSATALLVRTVHALLDVDPGFTSAGVLTLRVAPPQSRPSPGQTEEEFIRAYLAERDRMAVFYDRLLERVQALPGVRAAGAVNRLPLTGRWWSIGFTVEGRPAPLPGERPSATGRVATAGYFEAMGIPLRSGRVFDARDGSQAPAVAVVSAALARRHWPGQDPIGRRIVVDERTQATVVGVVADVRFEGLDLRPPDTIYVPFAQALFGLFPDWGLDLAVRGEGDGAPLAAQVRQALAALDSTLPVFAVRTMDEVVAASLAPRRAAMTLLAVFAGLAVLLSAVGLYGVVTQAARQRTREIGVRVALGAAPRDIHRLVLAEGLTLAAAGGVFGLLAAMAGGRVLSSLLFGVGPQDPAALLMAAAALAFIALAASLAPALRASRLDPLAALRDE